MKCSRSFVNCCSENKRSRHVKQSWKVGRSWEGSPHDPPVVVGRGRGGIVIRFHNGKGWVVWKTGVIVVTFFIHGRGRGVFEAAEVIWVLAVPIVVRVVFKPADIVWVLAVPVVVPWHEG